MMYAYQLVLVGPKNRLYGFRFTADERLGTVFTVLDHLELREIFGGLRLVQFEAKRVDLSEPLTFELSVPGTLFEAVA